VTRKGGSDAGASDDAVARLGGIVASVQWPDRPVVPASGLAAALRFVANWVVFWLPFLYLPLLAGGLAGQESTVFFGLLVLHAATVLARVRE